MAAQALRFKRSNRMGPGVRASIRRELVSGLQNVHDAARGDSGGQGLAYWIDAEWLSECLESGGIDHQLDDADRLHVTGIGFPAWLATDARARSIFAVSHCDALPGVDAAEALRFANHCNETFVQVQFVWSPGAARLYGHFALSFADGVNRRHVLRGLNRFGAIFARAVAEGAACGILSPAIGEMD